MEFFFGLILVVIGILAFFPKSDKPTRKFGAGMFNDTNTDSLNPFGHNINDL